MKGRDIMLTPKVIHEDFVRYNNESFELLQKNPWLIPATMAWVAIPAVVCMHGFWKNRQLKNQLKIEREKTKQMKYR